MASRLVRPGHRVVAKLPNLQAAVLHFRAFSSYDESETRMPNRISISSVQSETKWPNNQLGPFGPKNEKYPMPGNVGVLPKATTTVVFAHKKPTNMEKCDLMSAPIATDRHVAAISQFNIAPIEFGEVESIRTSHTLECIAQECPLIMRKDFKDLFPDKSLDDCDLTVITICQKTKNDMTGWSLQVDEEREDLLEQFVKGATEICEALRANNYWADFIDPSSGRPYLGKYTNSTMFETDERYRHFGFEISDLGCCKVITHHTWGTHAYVGCLFTDAPMYHPIICDMTNECDE